MVARVQSFLFLWQCLCLCRSSPRPAGTETSVVVENDVVFVWGSASVALETWRAHRSIRSRGCSTGSRSILLHSLSAATCGEVDERKMNPRIASSVDDIRRILNNRKDGNEKENPNRHPQLFATIVRQDQCAASSLQRSISGKDAEKVDPMWADPDLYVPGSTGSRRSRWRTAQRPMATAMPTEHYNSAKVIGGWFDPKPYLQDPPRTNGRFPQLAGEDCQPISLSQMPFWIIFHMEYGSHFEAKAIDFSIILAMFYFDTHPCTFRTHIVWNVSQFPANWCGWRLRLAGWSLSWKLSGQQEVLQDYRTAKYCENVNKACESYEHFMQESARRTRYI